MPFNSTCDAFHTFLTLLILLTKIAAPQNEVALSYHRVRGLYFLAVVFVTTIYILIKVFLKQLIVALINYIIISMVLDFFKFTRARMPFLNKIL